MSRKLSKHGKPSSSSLISILAEVGAKPTDRSRQQKE
jgi:hypothetical protein